MREIREPTIDDDFRTIVSELERLKQENAKLRGVKQRPIPARRLEAFEAELIRQQRIYASMLRTRVPRATLRPA